MRWVDVNRHIAENFPGYKGQLMFSMADLERVLGKDRKIIHRFIRIHNIPAYKLTPDGNPSYCMVEVVDALNAGKCR